MTLVPFADVESLPNIRTLIANKEIDMVVNFPTSLGSALRANYLTRRTAVDFGVPLLTDPQLFKMFVEALKKHKDGQLKFTQVAHTHSNHCIHLQIHSQ